MRKHALCQARSQNLEKRGGYFERVRSVQTILTRIFIALESVSHGLHETWDEISRKPRKLKAFFRPKSGGLQKKKKKKKKGLHRFWDWFFGQNRKSNVWGGGLFSDGGAIFNFSPKICLKSTKNVRFCILHKPMGGLSPPPWLRYCFVHNFYRADAQFKR